jgi:hypothetical protein
LSDKLCLKNVADILVFDEEGKYVAKIDTETSNVFSKSVLSSQINLYIGNFVLNKDILKFVSDETTKEYDNDFNEYLHDNNYEEYSVGDKNVKCKLVLETVYDDMQTGENKAMQIIIPKAEIHTNLLELQMTVEEITSFNNLFTIYKYDEKHFYKIKIKK